MINLRNAMKLRVSECHLIKRLSIRTLLYLQLVHKIGKCILFLFHLKLIIYEERNNLCLKIGVYVILGSTFC